MKSNLYLLLLFLIAGNTRVSSKDYRDNIFKKFVTSDFLEYYSKETCYEFEHNKMYRRLGILKNTFQEQKYNNLKNSTNKNKQHLYNLIVKKCKNQLLNRGLLKFSKFELITNLRPESKLEQVAFKLFCDKKVDEKCPYEIKNEVFDTLIRSKDYYIHDFFRYSINEYLKNSLTPKVSNYIKSENSTLTYYLLKDAYILYQCHIGRDCSNTSTFMVEKCLIDGEFCGLDVKTYFNKYKHSLSQSKDIQKVVEFLEHY